MNITGAIIRKLRLEENVSLEKLANKLNAEFDIRLSRGTISRWENGKSSPEYTNLKILAKHFNVTTDFLKGVSKNKHKNIDINSNNDEGIIKKRRPYLIDRITKILESEEFTSKELKLVEDYVKFLEYKRNKDKE